MFSHYQYFDELVEKMLRGDYDQHLREAWVWMCDRFVPYPFQNNIHRLPPDVFLECVMGIIEAQRADRRRDDFAEWISPSSVTASPDTSWRPYNFKVWAHPLDDDVDVVAGRPGARRRRANGSCENLLDDRDDVSWGPNNKFKFPLLGTGMLYERMAESLPKAVHLEKEAVRSTSTSQQGGTFADGSTADYDELVSTMPLTELVRLHPRAARPSVDRRRRSTSTTRRGSSSASESPSRVRSTKCWMYFPESDSPFYRVTYLSNYSPQMTPARRSLLAARRGVLVAVQARERRRRRRPHHRRDGERASCSRPSRRPTRS